MLYQRFLLVLHYKDMKKTTPLICQFRRRYISSTRLIAGLFNKSDTTLTSY